MKLFLDTANLNEIREIASLGILDGVTTNPSLMAKEGIRNFDQHYLEIAQLVQAGDISAEVIATDLEGILKEGRHLASLHPNIVVKVPFIKDGVKAIKIFHEENIRTNCTLIFSATQAWIASRAGATYVSPFVGRLDDISHDGIALIHEIRTIFDYSQTETQILSASLRHTKHVLDSALAGADVVTLPLTVFNGLLKHPLTDIGLQKFLDDHQKAMKNLS